MNEIELQELEIACRQIRNSLLAASDWVVIRAQEASEQTPQEWLAYRQALRELPSHPKWPECFSWPVEPTNA